jgi:hypothetical protein
VKLLGAYGNKIERGLRGLFRNYSEEKEKLRNIGSRLRNYGEVAGRFGFER